MSEKQQQVDPPPYEQLPEHQQQQQQPSQSQSELPAAGLRVPLSTTEPITARLGDTDLTDLGGQPVWVCSALCGDSVQPGKYAPHLDSPVRYAYGGAEVLHDGRFDVLAIHVENITRMGWVETSNGRIPEGSRPVEGGYEATGEHLYHALGLIDGIQVPGKTGVHLGKGHFAWNGAEHGCAATSIIDVHCNNNNMADDKQLSQGRAGSLPVASCRRPNSGRQKRHHVPRLDLNRRPQSANHYRQHSDTVIALTPRMSTLKVVQVNWHRKEFQSGSDSFLNATLAAALIMDAISGKEENKWRRLETRPSSRKGRSKRHRRHLHTRPALHQTSSNNLIQGTELAKKHHDSPSSNSNKAKPFDSAYDYCVWLK